MAIARSFRDLKTYQLGRQGTRRIFEISKGFPKEERYSLTDQVRRSSRAVKAILAEGWARRRYKPVFVNKLSEALGEATETQSWLDDALDTGYIDQETFNELDQLYQNVGGKLNTMIARADDFCKHDTRNVVREEHALYGTFDDDL